MRQFTTSYTLRNKILELISEQKMDQNYIEMLHYTINLFESQGLGVDYYGYHNINHELEVTYITMLSATRDKTYNITNKDLRYLFVAALFHDFDPQKSIDKPHENNVVKFITHDKKLQDLLKNTNIDLEIIKSLIYRTAYPWSGEIKKDANENINQCFMKSKITINNKDIQNHYMELGWFLSIADRIAGYALGDFSKAIEMAKMNAHALAWHPALIVRRSVTYFEHLLNEESDMCQRVLHSLPKYMRKNFMDNIISFLKLRQHEIQIHADYIYDNLKIVPVIERPSTRQGSEFIAVLFSIYTQLPKPLQFVKEKFAESVKDEQTILNTIRLENSKGEIVGFAKGGPMENYELRPEIRDENYGLNNTVFLEPLALKMGYWGLRGGTEMRHLFAMQAHAKKFTFLTSFALRDLVQKRINSNENVEFVKHFDPERWDYYRIKI